MFTDTAPAMSTSSAIVEPGTQWLSCFKHPRRFDPHPQNLTYLKYLDTIESESESEGESADDSDEPDETEEDGVDAPAGVLEGDDIPTPHRLVAACEEIPTSAVRRLRQSPPGAEKKSIHRHPDQQDEVAVFVEHWLDSRSSAPKSKPFVALLDDQIDWVGGATQGQGQADDEAYAGGLSGGDLSKRLKVPRFAETTPSARANTNCDKAGQAHRRVIYIPDMDAPEMETLASTASLTQREALLTYLDHHVKLEPLIGVSIPSNGFRVFVLHIHLPLFALRKHENLFRDPRETSDGAPLRRSWAVPSIRPASPSHKANTQSCLYEVQKSMTLCGIDDQVWTVYGTTDTEFDGAKSEDSVIHHHEDWIKTKRRLDPLTHRMLPACSRSPRKAPANASFNDARKYFWTVLDSWSADLENEYSVVLKSLREVLEHGCPNEIRKNVREFDKWNNHVLGLLQRILPILSDTIDAFDSFKTDLGYFSLEHKSQYLHNVQKRFQALKKFRTRFRDLESSAKINGKKVDKQIGFESHDAAVKVEVLAILAILFSPLSLVTAMFNIQTLPFSLSAGSFTISFVIVVVAYAAAYRIVLGWSGTIAPFIRDLYNYLTPFFHVALARTQSSLKAAINIVTAKAQVVPELQGSQPAECPAIPIQPPSPVCPRRRTSTWPLRSLSWKRPGNPPDNVELDVV
ncbi:hypothetical protein B0T16DRAFT_490885 [Cercophora newfieldiana]|uniref:Uncharacterized protein n=1 Tax=Cercophora newfieldiana TaxID=92897 RepID=A0AA39Y9S9_9PEZI|nr:hypothetical protein B0T16DRAFT_490885 [Cercophora newfieldiana]